MFPFSFVKTAGGGGAAPTVSSVAPTHAAALTATPIVVTGTGFVSGVGLGVTINGVACTAVVWDSSTQISCTTPASAFGGPYTLTVTNPDTQTGSLVAAYTFDFDLDSIAWDSSWRVAYAGSPWTESTANAYTLTEATNPPTAGSALGGLNCAVFDGTNDKLITSALGTDLFTVGAGSFAALLRIVTADLPASYGGAIGDALADPGLLHDNGAAYFAISLNATGPKVYINDSASNAGIQLTWSGDGDYLLQVKWNGTNLYARLNSDGWSSYAMGNVGYLGAAMLVGVNWAGTVFGKYKLREMRTKKTTLTDGDFTNVVAGFEGKYGIAL